MSELHLPWLELSILVPLVGSLWCRFLTDPQTSRRHAIVVAGASVALACGEFVDFSLLGSFEAHDHWDIFVWIFRQDVFVVDELSAPLLPLAALIFFVTILSTLRTKVERFSFSMTLLSEAILLATLSSRSSWILVVLLCLGVIPPWLEMRKRGKNTRVYEAHMFLFVGLLVIGYGLLRIDRGPDQIALVPGAILSCAALMRSGIVPVHCWMTDLFDKATLGTAILFATPLSGAYAVMRLVVPIAPDWALHTIAIISLITAVYAAGLALVQTDARSFYCYMLLSNSSLVLVGLELMTPIGLTGALCVWLSVGLSLTGFGITLRSIEARIGRVELHEYHGLFDQTPQLAGFSLLTGLASIGFPGTIGFVALELLVDGAVGVYPLVGTLVVLASALNGIAILHFYFRVFTGRRHFAPVSMGVRWPERIAILILTIAILGGGIAPQPGIASRYHAAVELRNHREVTEPAVAPNTSHTNIVLPLGTDTELAAER